MKIQRDRKNEKGGKLFEKKKIGWGGQKIERKIRRVLTVKQTQPVFVHEVATTPKSNKEAESVKITSSLKKKKTRRSNTSSRKGNKIGE